MSFAAAAFSVGQHVRLRADVAPFWPRRMFARRGIVVDVAFGPELVLVRWRGYPSAIHMQATDIEEAI